MPPATCHVQLEEEVAKRGTAAAAAGAAGAASGAAAGGAGGAAALEAKCARLEREKAALRRQLEDEQDARDEVRGGMRDNAACSNIRVLQGQGAMA